VGKEAKSLALQKEISLNNNNKPILECHSAVASAALAEQVS